MARGRWRPSKPGTMKRSRKNRSVSTPLTCGQHLERIKRGTRARHPQDSPPLPPNRRSALLSVPLDSWAHRHVSPVLCARQGLQLQLRLLRGQEQGHVRLRVPRILQRTRWRWRLQQQEPLLPGREQKHLSGRLRGQRWCLQSFRGGRPGRLWLRRWDGVRRGFRELWWRI